MFQQGLSKLLMILFYGIGTILATSQSQEEPVSLKSEVIKPEASKLVSTVNEAKPVKAEETQKTIAKPTDGKIEVAPIELLPHRATYSISLDKNHNDEDIGDAKGEMTIQLVKAGDGWAIEQKSTLHLYYKDGRAEQVITSLATYESLDGLKYSFNARTLRGDQEDVISGDAILASTGGAGIVTYQQPDESTIKLPVGTVFPTQHLVNMLEAAQKGQKVISNIVFDGSSETHEPVQVDTVLGSGADPKLALTNKELFNAKKVWPMRMAVYSVDSCTPEGDYEINQHVLDQGVIRDMVLDYGTFKVKAVLTQVDIFS